MYKYFHNNWRLCVYSSAPVILAAPPAGHDIHVQVAIRSRTFSLVPSPTSAWNKMAGGSKAGMRLKKFILKVCRLTSLQRLTEGTPGIQLYRDHGDYRD